MRPQGLAGSPLALFSSSSFQVAPPSVVLNNPLPLESVAFFPPERKVQPLRRKSHRPAKSVLESLGSIEIIEQPVEGLVERLEPLRILVQLLPPSMVL